MTAREWLAAFALALVLVLPVGGVALRAEVARARADEQAAFDRQLAERLVRALEAQARATERLVRATEHRR